MTEEIEADAQYTYDTITELRTEIERQREHIRKQAEDIIVLGREAGKAADKALIASNNHLRAEVEQLTRDLEIWKRNGGDILMRAEIELLKADNERLRTELTKIASDGKNCSDYCRRQAERALEPRP